MVTAVPPVAEKPGVSENTVKTYVRRVFAKTAVHARQELIDLIDEFEESPEQGRG